MEERTCAECGDAFTRPGNWICCSDECHIRRIYRYRREYQRSRRQRLKEPLASKACKYCERSFQPSRPNQLYCTYDCSISARNKRNVARLAELRRCTKCNGPVESRWGKPTCRACNRRNDPERNRQRGLAKYGMTIADFDALLVLQGGRCKICGTTDLSGRGWHVDHDHVTGLNRGVLCHSCNTGIGFFQDDPCRLRAAADYIEAHR